MKPALAIFVKTPGLSPVKTRLAHQIGETAALAFYRRAVDAVRSVAKASHSFLEPYWAVAEQEGLVADLWSDLPSHWQGSGELGERLDTVYSALQERHGAALLVGADAPQLTPGLLWQAADALRQTPYVIGRARDGGFWLFGGRRPVPRDIWTAVRYSAASTADDLSNRLAPPQWIGRVETLTDVDSAADLQPLCEALGRLALPLPEQQALLAWLREEPAIRQSLARDRALNA